MKGNQLFNQAALDAQQNRTFGPKPSNGSSGALDFLQRAEALRLSQECPHDLDMREYVSEPCKRYRYRRRVHWLDQQSHKLFLSGLKRDGGLFTVATYEQIRASAQRHAETDSPDPSGAADLLPASSTDMHSREDTTPRQLREVIELGYFDDRRRDRVKFNTRVLLMANGEELPGRTRDISATGIQLRTPSPEGIRVGDSVGVQFPERPETAGMTGKYRVIRIIRKLDEYFISLHSEEKGTNPIGSLVSNLLEKQVDAYQGPIQIDLEDAFLTAESLLAERHYMYSTALIPFYLTHSDHRSLSLALVSYNEANKESLLSFQTQAETNALLDILNRDHLHDLKKLAKVDGRTSATLAVWHAPNSGGLESIMDLQCKTEADWYAALARHRSKKEFRAFALLVRRVRRPNVYRLSREIQPLAEEMPANSGQLLRNANQLVALGALVDLTSAIRTWNLAPYESMLATKATVTTAEHGTGKSLPVDLLPIHYLATTRSHNRYVTQLPVTLEIQGRLIEALTQDVSLTGMSVLLPKGSPSVSAGSFVRTTLSGIAEHAGILTRMRKVLEGVTYEAVSSTSDSQSGALLRLRLREPDRQRGFTRALFTLLQKQQTALRLEHSNSVEAAASRLYSSFFIAGSAGLPVFYFRAGTDSATSARVGLARDPNPLAAFFETAEGRFDFSALTQPGWMDRLSHDLEDHGRIETILYLTKERIPHQSRFKISALADFELQDRVEKEAFFESSQGKDLRAVRIVVSKPHVPPSSEIELAVKGLEQYSSGRAARLRKEFENLVAIGDVMDITSGLSALRYVAP